jgi:hypothetical protein
MTVVRAAWPLAVLIALSFPAAAQVPTDTELTASYCLGWWRTSRAIITHELASRAMTDLDRQALSKVDDEIARLEEYLLAKSVALGDRNPLPFMIAQQRGEGDFRRCRASAQLPEIRACREKRCGALRKKAENDNRSLHAWLQCTEQCRPAACTHTCAEFKLPY